VFQAPPYTTPRVIQISDPMAPAFDAYDQHVSSSSGSGTLPVSPTLKHKKRNSSVTSITFAGESHWGSKVPNLVSLEVASQTPSITKRGFEYMYHKSHGYRLTGSGLYFGPVSSLVRRSQRDAPPRDVTPTCPDPGAVPPSLPVASIASGICGDSAKNVIKAAPLISLEEAKQREVSRRGRAAKRMLENEIRVEHEVRRFKSEVAEIVRKKEQAKREEGRLAHLEREALEALETLEKRKREEETTLTAAVAAREDGLVVAPTNWIVPLISLDQARHTEKAKRDVAGKSKSPMPRSSPPPASVDSLMVNSGNGNTTTLRLVSLAEAAKRDQERRLEADATDAIKSRTWMLAHAGTGLSHVPLVTLAEARKQDALRRGYGSSQGGDKPKSPNSTSKSRKPSHPPLSSQVSLAIEMGDRDRNALPKDAAAAQEKARWLALMSNAGNWWTRPNVTSNRSGFATARTPTGVPNWV
jgi:hypothetical protein